jgi:hypothetical protein
LARPVDRQDNSSATARPQAWSSKFGHARRQVAGQYAASVNDEAVLEWLRAEWARPFVGWDFSYLRERRETVDNKTWQLDDLLIDAVGRADAVLDIGTGDGRYLPACLLRSRIGRDWRVQPKPIHRMYRSPAIG